MVSKNAKLLLEKQQYRIIGNHSAVKICLWTKKSLRDEGFCYKQKFYGIKSHRCLQMTPNLTCVNKCIFCWRFIGNKESLYHKNINDPSFILEKSIEAQRKLLTGFKGFEKVNKRKWKEAQNPNQVAISLTGEPTQYPELREFIELCKSKGMTTYLVTNGQFPEKLEKIQEPTNLYLSVDAPTKELYKRMDIPQLSDFWERFNKTIELFPSFSCKKVARITVVKGYNDKSWKEYAKLIEKMQADFVEVKAYMWVGFSRYRLKEENMPLHEEIKSYSEELNEHLNYNYKDEHVPSRVVLLSRN